MKISKIEIIKGSTIVGGSNPDFDVDFSSESVEMVKSYMVDRFGASNVSPVGTYSTLGLKGGLKDLARYYNVDFKEANIASSIIDGLGDSTMTDLFKKAVTEPKLRRFIKNNPNIFYDLPLILDQPKARSIHPCAIIITPKQLQSKHWFPVIGNDGQLITEWEGGEIDSAGFLKQDILSTKILSKLESVLQMAIKNGKEIPDIYNLDYNDPKVYEYFANGYKSDVFQFEKGLGDWAKSLNPENLGDLSAGLALYRPGPMENGYHNSYVKRKQGLEKVEYFWGTEHILKDTYGLTCYQEQVSKICTDVAGFDLVTADEVRACLHEDTLMWTNDGYVRIKELEDRTKVLTYNDKTIDNKMNGARRAFFSGYKDCVKLTMDGGRELICTPDHKIFTNNGWKEAATIGDNDYVLQEFVEKFGTVDVCKDRLFLIVALITEGHLTEASCKFTNKDTRELDRFKDAYRNVFGREVKKCYNHTNGVVDLYILPSDIVELGLNYGLSDVKILPDYFMKLNKDCMLFVLGKMIDFDGCISADETISYSSKSKKLADQIHMLFNCLGVRPLMIKRFKEYYDSWYYEATIAENRGVCKVVEMLKGYSFKADIASIQPKSRIGSTKFIVPRNKWFNNIESRINESGYKRNHLFQVEGEYFTRALSAEKVTKLSMLVGRNKELEFYGKKEVCWTKVDSIEPCGKHNVYDFTMNTGCVPQAYANGILVHNCMGKKKVDKIAEYKDVFVEGATGNGCPKDEAVEMWDMMAEFAKYAFNKCVSGDTKILKPGTTSSKPKITVEEMYKIKNDIDYAKSVGKMSLRSKYLRLGYPMAYSMNSANIIVKNKIKDIRYEGKREVFEITTSSGKKIKTTDNHKFPVEKEMKQVKDLVVGEDALFVNTGSRTSDTGYRFTDKGRLNDEYYHSNDLVYEYKLNAKTGKRGFQKTPDSQYSKLIDYKKNKRKNYCELCGTYESKRFEVHHIDCNHGNNDHSNLQTLCVSCHKKEHYKMGRVKVGEKGLGTTREKIVSIESVGIEDVYDVEMEAPNHTFVTEEGIVTCNSHSVSYALISYAGQYLKVHFPLEFWATTFSYASDDKMSPFLSEIKEIGNVQVMPPDINKSDTLIRSDLEKMSIYWALSSIKNVAEKATGQIMEDRAKNGNYTSLDDFIERHNYKGSKVNKRVYEGLILAGAFDDIEQVKSPTERVNLMNKYREIVKVKIANKDKDWLHCIEHKKHEDWVWLLEQKRLSGLAFFDYQDLCVTHLNFNAFSADTINTPAENPVKGAIGGVVLDFIERRTKKGDLYAKVMIESNYNMCTLMIWSDTYGDGLDIEKGCIVLMYGELKFDSQYSQSNQVSSVKESKVKILK